MANALFPVFKLLISCFKAVTFIVLLLLTAALVNVMITTKTKLDRPPCLSSDVDFIAATDERVRRFSESLRIKTISYKPHVYEREATLQFHHFLEKSFPLIHSSPVIQRETVNELSLLYTITGSDATLKPYVLAGRR